MARHQVGRFEQLYSKPTSAPSSRRLRFEVPPVRLAHCCLRAKNPAHARHSSVSVPTRVRSAPAVGVPRVRHTTHTRRAYYSFYCYLSVLTDDYEGLHRRTTSHTTTSSALTTFPIFYAICMRKDRIIIENVVITRDCIDAPQHT